MAGLGDLVSRRLVDSGSKNVIRAAWDSLSRVPGGKVAFSRGIGLAAPYTATIDAHVEALEPGRSEVTMRDRRAVRNHLRCVHAVALANLVELAGNVAVAYTLPDDGRFIVSGMSLEYLKKARGMLRAFGQCPEVLGSEKREIEVRVRVLDDAGDDVVLGTLKTLIGPKKRPAG
ncbi:MAG TPA: DUF4442 domain-containing protein [Polyangiaceae bacterium]|nr:DUF4442 domain-containing protein [Polyangiaceae bacterium]